MSAGVFTALLTPAAFQREVFRLHPRAPFAIVERPDKIDFPGLNEEVEWTAWPRGRVFGPEVELRWEREEDGWRVFLISADEDEPPSGFEVALELGDADAQPEKLYYLWGEKATAIGGRLNYSRAIPGKGRGQLGVVHYVDPAGRLVFYRYTRLKREDDDAAEAEG